jgi:D-inositol-3-phosphate glycosyltransferase
MRKLLWVGDAGVPSGFARATHGILETVRQSYDVTVLGMNYRGDPHTYPYPIWAAAPGGDTFGIGRLIWMCDLVKPDVIVVQNDGWNIPMYISQLRKRLPSGEYAWPEYAGTPVVAIVAVDGKNFQGGWIKDVSLAIFWTQFALDEARLGGYAGPAAVIPLGVDRTVYYPTDKREARLRRVAPLVDKFIVGNVNRNQPRKRWDLTVRYFAAWVNSRQVDDAYLYLHAAPTGDTGCDVEQLARYYGVISRLALMQPPAWYGVPEDEMRDTYNCFDVQVNPGQGEGFGLTTLEGMACGVPQVVSAWSALGDWARGASIQVPCTSTAVGPPYVNVIGGVADEDLFVQALDSVYRDHNLRRGLGEQALSLAGQPCFRWSNIGQRFVAAVDGVLSPGIGEEVWRDLGRPAEVTV